jgi:hypothetical protein
MFARELNGFIEGLSTGGRHLLTASNLVIAAGLLILSL